jgi:beta-hydroxylase
VSLETSVTRASFLAPADYPELEPVRRNWRTIRAEGVSLQPRMFWIEDERTAGPQWAFAPLLVEDEDWTAELEEMSKEFRSLAPRTVQYINAIPRILACGFSLLLAGGRIGLHSHQNPFLTAMLGLSAADPCWIRVADETRPIRAGELIIFDYSLPHEVVNESDENRLVLLILLPNKSLATVTSTARD